MLPLGTQVLLLCCRLSWMSWHLHKHLRQDLQPFLAGHFPFVVHWIANGLEFLWKFLSRLWDSFADADADAVSRGVICLVFFQFALHRGPHIWRVFWLHSRSRLKTLLWPLPSGEVCCPGMIFTCPPITVLLSLFPSTHCCPRSPIWVETHTLSLGTTDHAFAHTTPSAWMHLPVLPDSCARCMGSSPRMMLLLGGWDRCCNLCY